MRRATEPRVLHVLPHPGGGGETYVDYVSGMDGYSFDRLYVAPKPRPSLSALAGALRAQITGRRFDLVHVHGEVAGALCLPVLALQPSVITINGLHLVRRLDGWMRSVAETNLRLLTRATSATICVSDSELAEVRAVVGESERVVLVRNGIDAVAPPTPDERAAIRSELGLGASDVAGVFLAALDTHKEPLLAARAAHAASAGGAPVVLLFVGEGPLRGELEALSGPTQAVRVLGYRRDARRILASADFFVLPSRREGLSFALLEAMSAGLVPVVSDAPGNRDAVGDAGVVIPAGDAEAFSSALMRLTRDDHSRRELGEQAKARASQFSSRQMIDSTRRIYEAVVRRA